MDSGFTIRWRHVIHNGDEAWEIDQRFSILKDIIHDSRFFRDTGAQIALNENENK